MINTLCTSDLCRICYWTRCCENECWIQIATTAVLDHDLVLKDRVTRVSPHRIASKMMAYASRRKWNWESTKKRWWSSEQQCLKGRCRRWRTKTEFRAWVRIDLSRRQNMQSCVEIINNTKRKKKRKNKARASSPNNQSWHFALGVAKPNKRPLLCG